MAIEPNLKDVYRINPDYTNVDHPQNNNFQWLKIQNTNLSMMNEIRLTGQQIGNFRTQRMGSFQHQ